MDNNNKESNKGKEKNSNEVSNDLIKNMENFTGEDEI